MEGLQVLHAERVQQHGDDSASRDAWLRRVAVEAMCVGALASAQKQAEARSSPLGVLDGLLADCPNEKSCASSQDDRPGVFQEPWVYESSTARARDRLLAYVREMQGAEVITADDRYIRAEFRDGDTLDDAEWFFTLNDDTVQFRSARRDGAGDRGANGRRMEQIRIALRFDKLPVLRNRKRALVFFESPWDSFGPTYGVDAPSPEELDRDQVFSDNDPAAPVWESPPPYPKR